MTLTLLVAHCTFVLTELISAHLVILGQSIRRSLIITTLVASMSLTFAIDAPPLSAHPVFLSLFGVAKVLHDR